MGTDDSELVDHHIADLLCTFMLCLGVNFSSQFQCRPFIRALSESLDNSWSNSYFVLRQFRCVLRRKDLYDVADDERGKPCRS